MNIREVLKEFVFYYDVTRQAGHTTAMMKGVLSMPKCIVVAHNDACGDFMKKEWHLGKGAIIVTPNSLDRLRGTKLPVLFDNAVLHDILRKAHDKIATLEYENEHLRKKFESIKEIINR